MVTATVHISGAPILDPSLAPLHRTTHTANKEQGELVVGVHRASRFPWSYSFTLSNENRYECHFA